MLAAVKQYKINQSPSEDSDSVIFMYCIDTNKNNPKKHVPSPPCPYCCAYPYVCVGSIKLKVCPAELVN